MDFAAGVYLSDTPRYTLYNVHVLIHAENRGRGEVNQREG